MKIEIGHNRAGPGRAVTSQDFFGPGRYGLRFQLGRAEDLQPWYYHDGRVTVKNPKWKIKFD